ncbi:MAG: SidJ-related pseudokinase [Deltaproteobacteria bacterium]|nr:SidJ-related pseudokinase [Deltaproteobacteria bacterium]
MTSDDLFAGRSTDFSARYMALVRLHERLKAHSEPMDSRVAVDIKKLLLKRAYDHQRQGFFLYREAAETLTTCVVRAGERKIVREALGTLIEVLGTTSGEVHRAVAGALGALPLKIKGPDIEVPPTDRLPAVHIDDALRQAGMQNRERGFDTVGRSLIFGPRADGLVLVFKMARSGDTPPTLQRESIWLELLHFRKSAFGRRFAIPKPVKIGNAFVFRLHGVPASRLPTEQELHPKGYAICFWADNTYFGYPNETCPGRRLGSRRFREVMFRNARILGRMAAMGILHDALIPLFHNRTQRGRRDDRGAYQWVRAGRLDRWLHSCAYPNIGVSGVRDFEHLLASDGKNGHFYLTIGQHFLSLLLVAGSYFRNKDTNLVGLDADGRPVDARGLFEKTVLEKIITGLFRNYYKGFVGRRFQGAVPLDPKRLSNRMIEEMGVDRHMEELVRVADQQTMTTAEFRSFLIDRGVAEERVGTYEKDRADIVINSGPHLGAFNAAISVPELIEAAGSMAAMCVAGKFWHARYGDS